MNTDKSHRKLLVIILAVYIILTLGITLLVREPLGEDFIQTVCFLGLKNHNTAILVHGALNIVLFVPIGVMVGLTARKNRLLLSTLAGLFISQTIECSQLIWQRGTFDVNDLLNNTVGALLGGAAVVLVFRLRRN